MKRAYFFEEIQKAAYDNDAILMEAILSVMHKKGEGEGEEITINPDMEEIKTIPEEVQIQVIDESEEDVSIWHEKTSPKKKTTEASENTTKSPKKTIKNIKKGQAPFVLEVFPACGINPNHITLDQIEYTSYRHQHLNHNLMTLWIKEQLFKRRKNLSNIVDRLSSVNPFYSSPLHTKTPTSTLSSSRKNDNPNVVPLEDTKRICKELHVKYKKVIDSISNFETSLERNYLGVCQILQHISESKKDILNGQPRPFPTASTPLDEIFDPDMLREMNLLFDGDKEKTRHLYKFLWDGFGNYWSFEMYECTRIDLLILCNTISSFYTSPKEMFQTLLGFDQKFPFFHQQEGMIHFFWSLLRPNLMSGKSVFFMDHMGTGKTFQSLINMHVYHLLFGWLSSVNMSQSFNVGTRGFFHKVDQCHFYNDSPNEFNLWISSLYAKCTSERDKMNHMAEYARRYNGGYTEFFDNEKEELEQFQEILERCNSDLNEEDDDDNLGENTKCLLPRYSIINLIGVYDKDMLLAHILRSIRDRSKENLPLSSKDAMFYKTHFAKFSKGIYVDGLAQVPQLYLEEGEGDGDEKMDTIETKEEETKKEVTDSKSRHDAILDVIFINTNEGGTRVNTNIQLDEDSETATTTATSSSSSSNDSKNITMNAFPNFYKKIHHIIDDKKIPFGSAISNMVNDRSYMSMARLYGSDMCAVTKSIRNSHIDFIDTEYKDHANGALGKRIKKWLVALTSSRTKLWDFFFSPSSCNSLPPLIVSPKASIIVWLEEIYKSNHCSRVAILSQALKDEIYKIIRKETHVKNSDLDFDRTTVVGKNETWYNSPRLVCAYPGFMEEMKPSILHGYDYALIHMDGLESQLKLINQFVYSVKDVANEILKIIESSKQGQLSGFVCTYITFIRYYRDVEYFKSVVTSVEKLRKSESVWKKFTHFHRIVKLITDGCESYISTYSNLGFFLNILSKSIIADSKLFSSITEDGKKVKEFFATTTTNLELYKEIRLIKEKLTILCRIVRSMERTLPATTPYFMSTSYSIHLDEAHVIRNINTTWDIFASLPTDVRSFLTGTPINNDESKELMNFVKLTSRFGPFNRQHELSQTDVYEGTTGNVVFLKALEVWRNMITNENDKGRQDSKHLSLLYDMILFKSPPSHYRREYPISFLGDRLTRSIPHQTRWNTFSESLGNIGIFQHCTQHKVHNTLNREQLLKNIESYQTKTTKTKSKSQKQSNRLASLFNKDGSVDSFHLNNGIYYRNDVTKSKKHTAGCLDLSIGDGEEKYTAEDIWGDNAKAFIVDCLGRRINMTTPWNMGGIPLSLIYAHNNPKSSTAMCPCCSCAARPYTEYKDVSVDQYTKIYKDDIVNSSFDRGEYSNDEESKCEPDTCEDSVEYEYTRCINPKPFQVGIKFGVMKNKRPYHPDNFICGPEDFLYGADMIRINHNMRALLFNQPAPASLQRKTVPQNQSSKIQMVPSLALFSSINKLQMMNEHEKQIERDKQKERQKLELQETVNKLKGGRGRPRKNASSKRDENKYTFNSPVVENMRGLLTGTEIAHKIRNDMMTSGLCECYSTDSSYIERSIEDLKTSLKSVIKEGEEDGLNIQAKMLLFMINYNGFRFQQNFGGCCRHNPMSMHGEALLSNSCADAVEELQIISKSIIDMDFKEMLLYRFVQSSVILFIKYINYRKANSSSSSGDALKINLEDFHSWYFLHSGEAIKDSNFYKSEAASMAPIFDQIFQRGTTATPIDIDDKLNDDNVDNENENFEKDGFTKTTRSWHSDKYILHDEDELISSIHLTEKEGNFVTEMSKEDLDNVNRIVVDMVKSRRKLVAENSPKHLPKFKYQETKILKELNVFGIHDTWTKDTDIFWGKSVPRPIIYKVTMSPEELEVYKFYLYGENMKKENSNLLHSLTECPDNFVDSKSLRDATRLLLSTIKNAMCCCENFFQKIPRSYPKNIKLSTISEETNSEDNNNSSNINTVNVIDGDDGKSDTDEDEEKEPIKRGRVSQKRQLYSEKLLKVFRTLGYDGKDILDKWQGLFNPSKVPSKYHAIVSYILNQTNICESTESDGQQDDDAMEKETKKVDEQQQPRDYMIIYIQTVKYADHLASYLKRFLNVKCSIYVGSKSALANERYSELKQFQNGETRILIASLTIAGTSLNIPIANHVIFSLAWWNPQLEEQAKFRVIRANQFKKVKFAIIVMSNALDEIILETGNRKCKGISGVFKNSSGIIRADRKNYVYIYVNRKGMEGEFSKKNAPLKDVAKNIAIFKKNSRQKQIEAKVLDVKGLTQKDAKDGNQNDNRSSTHSKTLHQEKQQQQDHVNKKKSSKVDKNVRISRFLEATKRLKDIDVIEEDMIEEEKEEATEIV